MFIYKSLTIEFETMNIYNNFKTIEKITIFYNTQNQKIHTLDILYLNLKLEISHNYI